MNLQKLGNFLESNKNYLISSKSDLKYLMGDNFIEEVEIFFKDNALKFLTNNLNHTEALKFFGSEYEVINIQKEGVLKSLFDGLDELIVEGEYVSMTRQKRLLDLGIKNIVSKYGLFNSLRKIKSVREIGLLKKSQEINKKALDEIIKIIKIGMTEFEISSLIKIKHLEFGAEGESFEPIVAFTEGGAAPHHKNSKKRLLTSKDQILFDIGCIYEGYCSDITRVIFMDDVGNKQRELYELLRNITYKCLEFGKVGMPYKELHLRATELLGEYSEYFTHGLGHGIGIDIHEFPLGIGKLEDKIQENEVFTIEPGIYFPDKYGFRYEIMALAKKGGFIEL